MLHRTVAEAAHRPGRRLLFDQRGYLISVGELLETTLLRQQAMLSATELRSVRAQGAVAALARVDFSAGGRVACHDAKCRREGFSGRGMRRFAPNDPLDTRTAAYDGTNRYA